MIGFVLMVWGLILIASLLAYPYIVWRMRGSGDPEVQDAARAIDDLGGLRGAARAGWEHGGGTPNIPEIWRQARRRRKARLQRRKDRRYVRRQARQARSDRRRAYNAQRRRA